MITGTFENKPIALYDADKKICIAIFDSPTTCAKYVLSKIANTRATSKVSMALRGKHTMKATTNDINVPLAFRLANKDQVNFLMNNAAVLLHEDYPQISFNIGLRFHHTRLSLFKEGMMKLHNINPFA